MMGACHLYTLVQIVYGVVSCVVCCKKSFFVFFSGIVVMDRLMLVVLRMPSEKNPTSHGHRPSLPSALEIQSLSCC